VPNNGIVRAGIALNRSMKRGAEELAGCHLEHTGFQKPLLT
jgi:hypothetical protein